MAKSKTTKPVKNTKTKSVKTVSKKTNLKSKPQKEITPLNRFNTYYSNIKNDASKIISTYNLNKKAPLIFGALLVLGLLLLLGKYGVVAMVDGRPITRFELYKELDKKYGKDLKEQLIVQRLINLEGQKRGVNVSNQELDAEIAKIEQEQGGKDNLNQVLQLQNISQDEFKNLVKLQLLRQKMFSENVNITDEEVAKYIENNKASIPELNDEDASPEAKLKIENEIKEQLKLQKIGQNFNTWLQEALKSSRVKRF